MNARRASGFTLIELMIVVAIIAIIAAVAVPNLLSARLNTNETSAIATLRSISTAQAQFHTSARVDVDNDGTGEFGFFRELSGAVGTRESADGSIIGAPVTPAGLSGSFRVITPTGLVSRSGYLFRLYLPDENGAGVPEVLNGAFPAALGVENTEITWGCYAWPGNYENSGRRSFFVNQKSNMVAADIPAYSGPALAANPLPGAALERSGGPVSSITARIALGTTGRDDNMWRPVD